MDRQYNISSGPHIRDKATTSSVMATVCIALIPACISGIYNFGLRALMVICVAIATCVTTEAIYEHYMKKPVTVLDLSAVVTGILLALNLPHTIPVGMVIIGSIFAILVVKQLFGGIGQNFMNPALAGRCFMLISFSGKMTDFVYDGISGATPLAVLKTGGHPDILKMFLGTTAGTIGETSTLAILIGAIILIVTGTISVRIPFSYLITFSVITYIYGLCNGRGADGYFLLTHLCGGGLMLGAFFMATDYVTSPITQAGQIVFGIIIGILTVAFRLAGKSAEGVSYAIIIGNLLVPLIERVTYPVAFGYKNSFKRVFKRGDM